MTPKTSVRECPICLDKFRNPVVTPCGHLTCDACIKSHAHNSSDPYEVTCPTCRAPFPIVTPHLSLVPKKFHIFISPPLRRVFLGEEEDSSRAVIEGLNAEIAALKASVGTLKREKDLLMDRCESAQSAVARLTSYERAARLARDEAKEEARLANRDLEELRVEHDKLQSRCARDQRSLPLPAKVEHTTGQATLDDDFFWASSDSSESSPRSTAINHPGRVIKPMPKKLAQLRLHQSARAASPEQTVQQSLAPLSWIPFTFRSPFASSSSSVPPPASVQPGRRKSDSGMRREMGITRGENTSSPSQDGPLPRSVYLRKKSSMIRRRDRRVR